MHSVSQPGSSPPLIVAVSGGVDSVVLLDWLVKNTAAKLVVAHVNHGMRNDSHEDEALVRDLARQYSLPFEVTRLELEQYSSELTARNARYDWLDEIARQYAATTATAHHQDDVLETILLNLARGSGWRGIASLRSHPQRYRPLLSWPKSEVVRYAIDHDLTWREDSTNEDVRYRRNYLRHGVAGGLTSLQRQKAIELYEAQLSLRQTIDTEIRQLIARLCSGEDGSVARYELIMLPDSVAMEVLRGLLPVSLTRPQLRRLLWLVKTAQPNTQHAVGDNYSVRLTRGQLIV